MSAAADLLVADIGGTNARCALASVGDRAELDGTRQYRCSDLSSIDAMLTRYSADTGRMLPERVALAVAGPVTGDRITLTNNDWNFSIEQVKRRFGLSQLVVMNDLVAVAHATSSVGPHECLALKAGRARAGATRVVIGVGTGLGVAALTRTQEGWVAVPSEAGHAAFPPNIDIASDRAVMDAADFDTQSWESMLSGPGLERRFEALTGRRATSFTIVEGAHAGDVDSVAAVNDMCQTLARFASDAAVWFNARGGVYLAGGLLHDLTPWLKSADFAASFARDGAMSDFVKPIPVSLIVADQPGLIGAAIGAHSVYIDASRVPAQEPATEIRK